MQQGTCTVVNCEWMKKRAAAVLSADASSATSSAVELVNQGTRIVELQEKVRAGYAFFLF